MTITTEKEIEEAKTRVVFLRDRLQSLQAEQEQLKGRRETNQEKILQAYIEGKEPEKMKADAARDLEQLRFIGDAIKLCKKQLAEAEGIASTENRLNYQKQVADFQRRLIGFIDKDFSAMLKEYQRLEAAYWLLINQGHAFPDLYPAREKQIFEIFFYSMNKDSIPADLASTDRRFNGFFEIMRNVK